MKKDDTTFFGHKRHNGVIIDILKLFLFCVSVIVLS